MTMLKMNAGKAMAIFKQIDSDKYTDEEKAEAIFVVMQMPTHMSQTKDEAFKVIKWLVGKCFEFVIESEGDENDEASGS